jgi:hypothetical protein
MINRMKTRHDERGQALVISILAMTVLIGFVALASDIGVMLHEKRLLQTAADAAAIAGAVELPYGDWNAAATSAATTNGFTAGANTTITVQNPPTSGYHENASSVEVIISQQVPTLFMRLFSWTQMTVSARAVAESGAGVSDGCGYSLGTPGDKNSGMQLQGSFDVSAPSCGLLVNGVLSFTGNGGSLNAGYVGYAAGESTSGNQAPPSTPAPVQMAPVNDPLADKITFPDTSKLNCAVPSGTGVTSKKTGGTTTYTMTGEFAPPSGSSIACYSGAINLAGVTLDTGTYVFTGDVTLANPATGTYSVQTGTGGATIDIAGGALTDSSNGLYNLTAPTTGDYHDIALMQPPSDTNIISLQTGNSLGSISGIIYAPTAELYFNDSGGDSKGGTTLTGATNLKIDFVVGSLDDKTAAISIVGYAQSNGGSSYFTKTALVE